MILHRLWKTMTQYKRRRGKRRWGDGRGGEEDRSYQREHSTWVKGFTLHMFSVLLTTVNCSLRWVLNVTVVFSVPAFLCSKWHQNVHHDFVVMLVVWMWNVPYWPMCLNSWSPAGCGTFQRRSLGGGRTLLRVSCEALQSGSTSPSPYTLCVRMHYAPAPALSPPWWTVFLWICKPKRTLPKIVRVFCHSNRKESKPGFGRAECHLLSSHISVHTGVNPSNSGVGIHCHVASDSSC